MSERTPVRPTYADNVGWNTGGVNPSVDPGALRVSGWGTDAEPASSEFNYLQTLWGLFLQYLEGHAQRRFDDTHEGITVCSAGQSFVWHPSNAARMVPWTTYSFSAVNDTGHAIVSLCTDGQYVYAISTLELMAVELTGGSNAWDVALSASDSLESVCTDGNAVYLFAGSALTGCRRYNKASGALVAASADANYGCIECAANGAYVVGIAPSGTLTNILFYDATPTYLGVVTVGVSQHCVALDAVAAYVGYEDAATEYVAAYNLATRALIWSYDVGTYAPSGIAADGDCVYVACDRHSIGADPANLLCLSAYDGTLLWYLDVGSTVDLSRVRCNGDSLIVVDSAGGIYQVDLTINGRVVRGVWTGGSLITTDGIATTVVSAGTPTTLTRFYHGRPGQRFLRMAGTEVGRKPLHQLAIPIK